MLQMLQCLPPASQGHTQKVLPSAEKVRETTPVKGSRRKVGVCLLVEGGWFNWSVLIWIWSWDVWGEGWIRKRWSIEETLGVRFQLYEGPLSPDSLKLPLFDWEPESERERESGGKREEEGRAVFSLEWMRARQSELHLSLSLSLSLSAPHINGATLAWT